ncbi:DUF3088 family protein [Pseudodesulfovibrio nedwellii]|uniref:DUF3088 family protein n=1 Tax=Pseudodesulfovibrio nedwellii TaxID=2973072 RepID=UPI00255957B5|nr:DUF3088 family protein [Pseudodesulfovibrio nedwellii]
MLEGLLGYFPQLREELDVKTIEFVRPRASIITFLGEKNQECPCLILADPTKAKGLPIQQYGPHTFITDDKIIIEYLARNNGISRPAHD